MGVSILTAIEIQNVPEEEFSFSAGQDKKTKKWAAYLIRHHDGVAHKTLLSFDAAFDSEEEAIAAMKETFQAIKDVDLNNPGGPDGQQDDEGGVPADG